MERKEISNMSNINSLSMFDLCLL